MIYSERIIGPAFFEGADINLLGALEEPFGFFICMFCKTIYESFDVPPIYECRTGLFVRDGYAFSLTGSIAENGDRFIIDFILCKDEEDIALRLDVCASKKSLSRNSRIRRRWGRQERALENPFRLVKLKRFELEVLFTDEYIYIAFDGIHLAKYSHRVSTYDDIEIIKVRGDIIDLRTDHGFIVDYPSRARNTYRLQGRYAETARTEDIELDDESEETDESVDAEQEFLPLPCFARFSQGFLKQGYGIIVTGRISSNPKTITVALQDGHSVWPKPVIIMQLTIRFKKKRHARKSSPVIAFNSFINLEWTGEVNAIPPTGLLPGTAFDLRIVCGRLSFEIYLNDRHLTNYRYFIDPTHVNTCHVHGDIKLWDVLIESD